jgi:hypothetical protein
MRVDSKSPIIDNKPQVEKEWQTYTTVVTEKTDMDRFTESMSESVGINDWKPVKFPEQIISVASIVVPVTKTLETTEVGLQGNKFHYEFNLIENKSTNSDLSNPYLFSVIDLWDLNGHDIPTDSSAHIDGIDEV